MSAFLAGLAGSTLSAGLDFGMAALENKQNKQATSLQNYGNAWMEGNRRAYNTPSAQMQRFKDAGLNPNLIYGKLDNSMPGGSPVQKPTIRQPTGSLKSLSNASNWVMQDQQIDNLQKQQNLIAADIRLRDSSVQKNNMEIFKGFGEAARTRGLMANDAVSRARAQFDLQLAKKLEDTTVDAAINSNRRAAAAADLQELAFEIGSQTKADAIARINADLQLTLQRLETEKQRTGLTKAQWTKTGWEATQARINAIMANYDQKLYETTGLRMSDGYVNRFLTGSLPEGAPTLGGIVGTAKGIAAGGVLNYAASWLFKRYKPLTFGKKVPTKPWVGKHPVTGKYYTPPRGGKAPYPRLPKIR